MVHYVKTAKGVKNILRYGIRDITSNICNEIPVPKYWLYIGYICNETSTLQNY